MPTRLTVPRLLAALDAHAEMRKDAEGRSALDALAAESRAEGCPVRGWAIVLSAVGHEKLNEPVSRWGALEYFISVGHRELVNDALLSALEEAISSRRLLEPRARLSAYSILRSRGWAPNGALVAEDVGVKSEAPVRWLDLVLSANPDNTKCQAIVIEAIRAGHFTAKHYGQRLVTMRRLGGEQLTNWLDRLRHAFPASELEEFDEITKEAFGTPSHSLRPPKLLQHNAVQRHISLLKEKQRTGRKQMEAA